jgi:hypothetical protein
VVSQEVVRLVRLVNFAQGESSYAVFYIHTTEIFAILSILCEAKKAAVVLGSGEVIGVSRAQHPTGFRAWRLPMLSKDITSSIPLQNGSSPSHAIAFCYCSTQVPIERKDVAPLVRLSLVLRYLCTSLNLRHAWGYADTSKPSICLCPPVSRLRRWNVVWEQR